MNARSISPIRERGFIALLSVIVISAMLLTFVYTLNTASFFSRADALQAEDRRTSLVLAEACIEAGMLKLVQRADYVPASGGDCVGVADTCGVSGAAQICSICSVEASLNTRTIVARAAFHGAYTTIRVEGTLMPHGFSVTRWSKPSLYDGPPCVIP